MHRRFISKSTILRILLHLLAIFGTIWLVSILRSHVVPELSGYEQVFPRNISATYDAKELNDWRTQHAQAVLKQRFSHSQIMRHDLNATNMRKKFERLRALSIVIIASGREGYFLTQVIASLLELYENMEEQVELVICNVSEQYDPEIEHLSRIVKTVAITRPITWNLSYPLQSYAERIRKETNDYWACMNVTHNSRYLLLLEDDALPIPRFTDLLMGVTKHLDWDKEIDFVKLYHPIYLRKLPYYVQLTLSSLFIALLLTYFVWRTIALLPFLITFIIFVDHFNTHYTCQFFAELRYAITGVPYLALPESCCTPAVLYRRKKLPQIMEYFRMSMASSSNTGTKNDTINSNSNKNNNNLLAKDDILDGSPFKARLTDANLVIHIGYMSKIRGKIVILDAIRYLKQREEFSQMGEFLFSL